MSISQSRYSIIERLTESKLLVLEEDGRLNEAIRNQKSKITNLENELKNWEIEVVQENKIEKNRREAIIEKAIQDLINLEENAKIKKDKVKEKIETIDRALTSIEKINKSTPTVNS